MASIALKVLSQLKWQGGCSIGFLGAFFLCPVKNVITASRESSLNEVLCPDFSDFWSQPISFQHFLAKKTNKKRNWSGIWCTLNKSGFLFSSKEIKKCGAVPSGCALAFLVMVGSEIGAGRFLSLQMLGTEFFSRHFCGQSFWSFWSLGSLV